MKKRLLSLVLCLVMVFSLFPMIEAPVFAADENGTITNPAPAQDTSGNLHLTKTLAPGANGTYDITMESWATGEVKTHVYNEQIPTDYVLIADQSGSMSTNDVPTGYNNGTTKNWKVSDGANAYYYKETDANGVDHYYRVYRKYGDMFEYHAPDTVYTGDCIGNLSWFQRETVQDLGAASEYYYNPALDTSNMRTGVSTDNRMYPVRVSSQGAALSYWIRFRFTDINGTTYALKYPDTPYYKSPTGGLFGPGDWWGPVPYTSRLLPPLVGANDACKALSGNNNERYTYGEFLGITTGMYVRQVLFSRHNDYSQLAYRDDNGVEHLLIDATYCNSSGTPVGGACGANGVPSQDHTSTTEAYWNGTLYSATGKTTTRLNALKQAMNEFINTVAAQQNDDGSKPNHRVAIVGFAGGQSDSNTELLTGTNFNISTSWGEKSGIQYRSLNNDYYKNALLDVTNGSQLTRLRSAVDALEADGGTEGQYGFYMAKNILDQRELTKFTTKGGSEVDRLTIVVYFTDGTPGNYDNDNQYAFGNEVVDAAHQLKTDTKVPNVEIYSIGTFGFADSEPLVYEKYTGNNSEYKYDPDYVKTLSGTWQSGYMYRLWVRNTQGYGDVATDTVYDYIRTITTEYPNATKFVDASWYGTGTKSDNGVYTNMVSRVRGESNGLRRYFLCTDLSGLSRVFTTIGSEEASSSTQVTLDSGAVLHDTVNTANFDTANASVSAYTVAAYKNGTFGTTPIRTWPTGSDKLTFDKTTGEVTVSDFNYSEKYVNSLQDGEKLVVKITGLTAKHPGDDMPSNDGNAYIKAKDAEANAVEIASPTLTLAKTASYYVADFNAPLIVATDVAEDGIVNPTSNNGTFSRTNASQAVYKLTSGTQHVAAGSTIAINSAYTKADTAVITGKHVEDGPDAKITEQTVTVVPGSSVYYDDDLTTAIPVGDGSGYNEQVAVSPTTTEAATGANSISITFYGTGIDIYCTTDSDSGYIQAKCDGANVQTTKNQSVTTRYNVPTVSYSGLTYGEHTVTLTILSSSHYKLDGVRVYGPVNNQNLYNDTPDEKNAAYINMREALVNDNGVTQAFSDSMTDTVLGALFVDDSTKLKRYVTATEDEISAAEIELFFKNGDEYVKVTTETPAPTDAVL